MYLRSLSLEHLKRISKLTLTFPEAVRSGRGLSRVPWTVLIGENGTCKTAILQAIALAAAGHTVGNRLIERHVSHLRDRRSDSPLRVSADFAFAHTMPPDAALRPGLPPAWTGCAGFSSQLALSAGATSYEGRASYCAPPGLPPVPSERQDPLDEARRQGLPWWFAAAYGVSRLLPDAAYRPAGLNHGDRLRGLFDPTAQLTSTSFANYFADDPRRSRGFAKILKQILVPPKGEPLLPELTDLILSGRGGVTRAADLLERQRFKQRMGGQELGIPGVALAHGYQSTIAWIADLIGHILLEAQTDISPREMAGLVLVDEIDLYIHPGLQVSLIRSLQRTFPLLQFVVTTHSPLVLAALRPDEDEIVRLSVDAGSGDVVQVDMKQGRMHEPDARTMTTAALYQRYFGLPDVYGGPEGNQLARYQLLAADAYRSAAEEREMRALADGLRQSGVELGYEPVPRHRDGERA